MSPSNVAGGQYGSVRGKNSHAVARVVNARPYIVAILGFRQLRVGSLYAADGWFEERPHRSTGGR